MATYVLVHGGWHGGWCWRKVVPHLTGAGHSVYTPTLTGHGDRAHLLRPDVGLSTHTADIQALLSYEDLAGVVLVGHSYGGMVITDVVGRTPERVVHLVYLDAFVPRSGQCLFDLVASDFRQLLLEQLTSAGDGWRMPSPPLARWGVTDADDLAWAGVRVGDQSLLTFTQPVRTGIEKIGTARTYIACTDYRGSFTPFAESARGDQQWRYRELATGHDAMITAPNELAELLLELV